MSLLASCASSAGVATVGQAALSSLREAERAEDGEKLVVARKQVRGRRVAIALARAVEVSNSSTFPRPTRAVVPSRLMQPLVPGASKGDGKFTHQ
jgi:hypothetical protein